MNFDMDGLLTDREPMHQKAFDIGFRKYGKESTAEEYAKKYVGIADMEAAEDMIERFDLPTSPVEMVTRKQVIYVNYLKDVINPNQGLIELLKYLKKKQIKIAIASSSTLKEIETVIIGLKIIQYIEVYCSAEEVEKGKPFPDIFLLAAKRLEVKPGECVVLEDAPSGVKAARAAGMKCLVVPSRET